MPIHGLTDIRRLPRIGKIRLGEKKESERTGKEYPTAVDYFICPDEVKAVYGDQPRSLNILFPSDTIEEFAPAHYKRYGSFGLMCKGDGESAVEAVTEAKKGDNGTFQEPTGELKEIDCLGKDCQHYQKKYCKQVMNLMFMLPDVPGLGVYQLDTTSFHSIVGLYSSVELVKAILGQIKMVPLELAVIPKEVQPEGKKKTVFVLEVRANLKLSELRAVNGGAFALPGPDVTDEMPRELVSTVAVPDEEVPADPKTAERIELENALVLIVAAGVTKGTIKLGKAQAIRDGIDGMDDAGILSLINDLKSDDQEPQQSVVLVETVKGTPTGKGNAKPKDPFNEEDIDTKIIEELEASAKKNSPPAPPVEVPPVNQSWGF